MKDLSLHLMDIMQNSLTAGASHVEVTVRAEKKKAEALPAAGELAEQKRHSSGEGDGVEEGDVPR